MNRFTLTLLPELASVTLTGKVFGVAGLNGYICWVEFQHTLVECLGLLLVVIYEVNYTCGGTKVVPLDSVYYQNILCSNLQGFIGLDAITHQKDPYLLDPL